jgi:hypothetical protein
MMSGADVGDPGTSGYNFTIFCCCCSRCCLPISPKLLPKRGQSPGRKPAENPERHARQKTVDDGSALQPFLPLQRGDRFVCEAGDIIPTTAKSLKGLATLMKAPSRANQLR